MARHIQIADLIAELQAIEARWGNTCVHIRGLSWGSVALWNQSADEGRQEPGGCIACGAVHPDDRVRLETASQIRDVLTRIGPACTREWVREQLKRIVNQLEFHARVSHDAAVPGVPSDAGRDLLPG